MTATKESGIKLRILMYLSLQLNSNIVKVWTNFIFGINVSSTGTSTTYDSFKSFYEPRTDVVSNIHNTKNHDINVRDVSCLFETATKIWDQHLST